MKFLVLMAEEDTWNRWNALSDGEQQAVFDRFTAPSPRRCEERGTVLAGEALDRPRAGAHGPARSPTGRSPTARSPRRSSSWAASALVDLPDLDTARRAGAGCCPRPTASRSGRSSTWASDRGPPIG